MTRALILHVHKTGGTSVLASLGAALGAQAVNASYLADAYRQESDVFTRSTLENARVLMGHHVHQLMWPAAGVLEPVLVATILRDPLERALSLCAHTERLSPRSRVRPLDFAAYAERNNPISRFILRRFPAWDPRRGSLEDRVHRVLSQFSMVVDVSELSTIAAFLSERLATPIEQPRRLNGRPSTQPLATPSRSALQTFARNHAADIEIYRRTCDGAYMSGAPAALATGKPGGRDMAKVRAFVAFTVVRALWQAGRREASLGQGPVPWVVRNSLV